MENNYNNLIQILQRCACLGAVNGSKEAIKIVFDRNEERHYDKRLKNTKLLLSQYRNLSKHIKESIFDIADEYSSKTLNKEESLIELLNDIENVDNDTYVSSIKESKEKTVIMLQHINNMLEVYKYDCINKSNKSLHWNIIYDLYIADEALTRYQISEKYGVSERDIYRYVNQAVESLSILLFGVEAIQLTI